MDTYLLKAAVLYALSATARTSTAIDDFLQIASFASPDLDPLAYELFDLRPPLERLVDSLELVVPRTLQAPVLAIVRASGDALARIDTLLEDCTAEESCAVRWNAVRPKVHELQAGLCTCRRTLQLALEVVNLAASKDDGTDADTLTTYLDQDTSRILALIRRTLQHVQEEDQTDDLYQALRTSLDEIRLVIQGMCKHRDETKLAALQMAASGASSHAQSQSHDTSTLVSEPEEVSSDHGEARGDDVPSPLITGLRPAKKLTSALAKWSLAGASKRSKLSSSLSSTSNSLLGTSPAITASSAVSTNGTSIQTDLDGISFIDMSHNSNNSSNSNSNSNSNNGVQTCRRTSHRSESSHTSSSSGRAGRPPSRHARMASSSNSTMAHDMHSHAPLLPPKNPRRSTITPTDDDLESLREGFVLPSPLTPSFDMPSTSFSTASVRTGSLRSRTSERAATAAATVAIEAPASPSPSAGTTPLPLFAISPPDKIIIDPADVPAHWNRPTRTPEIAFSAPSPSPSLHLRRTRLISPSSSKSLDNNNNNNNSSSNNKGEGGHASTVFWVDPSPASYLLASKHGDKTIKVHGLPQGNLQASLKVNFYVQMQDRTRDFFVLSHAILSETRTLLAAATRFGDTLEIWNWALPKRVQTIEGAVNRWAVARGDMYVYDKTGYGPLACYREVDDTIQFYHPVVANDGAVVVPQDRKKTPPFGTTPTTRISLREAGLPAVPKLPELAYSSTAPLLVAAAGPRSPRPGHAPPQHAAMLMAWDLSGSSSGGGGGGGAHATGIQQRPLYFCMPAHHRELETALPCGLVVHGDHVVSLWIPHNVRVVGSPGLWQVEPVQVPNRYVLVWNLRADTTCVFPIPNENTVACISPDARYVAYRQGSEKRARVAGGNSASLVVLDALDGGRELWRTPARPLLQDPFLEPSKISSLSFSLDGGLLLVGDTRGSIGVYDVIPAEGGQS